MRQRQLGRTGLKVSVLGLGLAALGRPGYLTVGHGQDLGGDLGDDRSPEAMERHAHEVLDAAHAAGITYVDAARSYGRAEEFLASWLRTREVAPGAVVVGTKWGYTYTAGWRVDAEVHEVKDHGLAAFERQLPESIALLGEHLALEQVHSVTPDSPLLDDVATLEALAELRDRGVAIGISTSGPAQADVIRRALAIDIDGPLVQCVQATWNVLEPSAGDALREARAAGVGVIVKEAVANGRLTARGDAGAALRTLVPDGAPPDAAAIAAALAADVADVVLSGAATVEQLRSNLVALELVDVVDLDALSGAAEEPAAYWAHRSAMPWT